MSCTVCRAHQAQFLLIVSVTHLFPPFSRKEFKEAAAGLPNFILVCTRHYVIYFPKTSKPRSLPGRINTVVLYWTMGKVRHMLDLPKGRAPMNPGPSDSKPVLLPLDLSASPTAVAQQCSGLIELPVKSVN